MGYLTTAEVAKAIRADIKTARKNGQLGDLPAGLKISVTSSHALRIEITGAPTEWGWTGERYTHTERTSDAARELGAKLADIARPHHAKGYEFGFVLIDGASIGGRACLGKPGWTPGLD